MKRTTRIIASVLTLTAVAVAASLVFQGVPVRADWYDCDHHIQLEIQNNATVPLPSGYTVSLLLDTASLITQGQMRADCADLSISYDDGVTESDLDRLVEACGTSSTAVTFRTQAEIGVGSADMDYRLHYGNAAATDPPADPNNVYAFYDDFEDGDAAAWNGIKGTWSVVDDGGNYVYRYTGGGANWAISYVDLPGVSDLEYVAKIRATDSLYTNWIGSAFRIQNQDNFLTFYQSRDSHRFKFARIVADNHHYDLEPPFTMPADTWHWLRVRAIGSQVQARIWPDGTAEPAGWNIEATESSFQSETNIGATLYHHTTVADWDDVRVRKLVDNEPTVILHWESAPWWDTAWAYRLRLTVANNSTADTLPTGYSVVVTLDTSALIAAGQMLGNCDDLRVVSFDGVSNTEIDRIVEGCGTDHTEVWFATQRTIAPGGEDDNTYIYYGNPSAGTPPADGMNVFAFYEDWEQGTVHWTSAGGLDPGDTGTMGTSVLSDEEWVSPSHSQEFPQKAAGGDAFSGYIPVTPGTGYAIGVWGKSATSAYAPVGFDPYDASYNQGSEVWLWTSEWTVGAEWSRRSGTFATSASTAYIKIKSEWWSQGPGTEPVYMDNLVLRYALADEPAVTPGEEETILPVPVIVAIEDTGPVDVGTDISVTAVVSSTEGTIDAVTLRVLSPETIDVGMSLIAGDVLSGTWQGSFTPSEGGPYTYRVLATSSVGRSKLSAAQTFTATDALPPEITLVSITDPIEVRNTQTLTVTVTDNGRVDRVALEVEGSVHPMTQHGDQYDYPWRVTAVGTITYTVTATDTVGNSADLVGSFESLAREVDVCAWQGCKPGAASWSIDDGHTDCLSDLEAAGFRGTYYYNGSSTRDWFATYSAAGHEIGSHTVSHPCDRPCCYPNCTPEAIWECPYTEAEVNAYRQNQLEPNIAAIEAGTGIPVVSLAWPCGCADARRMTAASYDYLGARGYYDHVALLYWVQDVNEPTPTEFMNLNSANSYDQTFIDRAIAEGKWAIITSHGSCAGISYIGSRQDVLWAAPVGEVLKYILVRDAATFTNYNRFGRTIGFDAAHNLDTFERQRVDGTPMSPIAFDNPVTLKVHILDTDDVLGVEVDGAPVSYTVQTLEDARYVLFDASLDVTRHVTVTLAQPAPTIEEVSDNSPVEFGDAARITATVTIEEGTVQTVTLRVLSPEAADYPMNLATGTTDTYTASFVPGQIADVTYRVLASNDEGNTAQSPVRTLVVRDTTPPSWRAQSQAHDAILVGAPNTLTAEGLDIGGLKWAVLATDESGAWQEFTWPVSDWWDHDWAYRRPITVTETAGLTRTAETVDLFISEAEFPGLTSCIAELRVADESGIEVPVQVYDERTDGGTLTCHLLFQASVDANASRTYYIYYGNPSATPPTYATDLTSFTAADLLTVRNSFFELDLDTDGGVVSRMRLPGGSDTDLPLSPESDRYWGWHQVCSSADGNVTGRNALCVGGSAPATGLTLATTLDGPIVKEFAFTNVRGAATYTMTFRFFANAPRYEYTLTRTGTSASVMNNFWYANGNFARLGAGSGGAPSVVYNTYSYGADQARIASFAPVDYASIDGTDNDGTDLGGTDYRHPSASGLALYVTTGPTQEATEAMLGRLAAPATLELGPVEEAPEGQYGSPMDAGGATGWTATAFTWQNPAVPHGTVVHWRIRYCDLSENCGTTDVMSFTVVSSLADLSAAKTGSPDPAIAGEALTYTVGVTNSGPSDATGVVLTDMLPAEVTFRSAAPSQGECSGTNPVTCDLGNLANGATATVTIVVTPTTVGTISNTVSVTGDDFDPSAGNDTDTAIVDVVHPDLAIAKTPDTQIVHSGSNVAFTIAVTNTGDVDLSNVRVTDALAEDCSRTIGDMAAGERESYTCVVEGVTASFTNTATVTGTASVVGVDVTATDAATVTVIYPAVEVVKTATPTVARVGDRVVYTITVENVGDSDLTGVAVSDHLDGCTLRGPVGDTQNPGVLDPEELWAYACFITAGDDDIVNTATVDATDQAGGTVSGSSTATVTVIHPAVEIVKTAAPTVVHVGDTVDYTLTVHNVGDAALTGVTVDDALADCTLSPPVGDTQNPGVLDPQEVWAYTCSVTAGSTDIENTATVTATDAAGGTVSHSDTAFVDVINPYVHFVKTAAPTVVHVGDTVAYTITAENIGDAPLTGVTVEDHLAGCVLSGPEGNVGNPGALDPHEVWAYTCSVVADSADIENTATITATDAAGGSVTDSAHAEVDVIHPAIEVAKTPDAQTVREGAAVTFTIAVANTGDVALTDVTVTDPQAPQCGRSIGALAPGGSARHTCVVEDVSASFTNTATVAAIDPIDRRVGDTGTATVIVEPAGRTIYLPLVLRRAVSAAPDLVVERIAVTADSVQVVIANRGDAPVLSEDPFWVDLYVDPDPIPTGVNQTWESLCDEGIVWGVEGPALPLEPGDTLTLTMGDAYHWPAYSRFSGSFTAGTPIYVQVDSADVKTTYGAVLEGHEMVGGPYNNVGGPAFPALTAAGAEPAGTERPAVADRSPVPSHHLPPRP